MANYSNVISHMQNSRKIDAIKEMRVQTGLGLKEAKDLVEAFYDFVRAPAAQDVYNNPFVQEPYKEETYVVFSNGNNGSSYDWYCNYTGPLRTSATADANIASAAGDDVVVAKVVARTKKTLVWED